MELCELSIAMLQPSQFYVSEEKLTAVRRWLRPDDLSNFEPIPIKWLDGRPVMTDGHTRAVAALLAGLTRVPLAWDTDQLDWTMYRRCVSACLERGVDSPEMLLERVVPAAEYEERWLGWCRTMHAGEEYNRKEEFHMPTILDGKAFAALCKENIKKEVERLTALGHRPGLAVVLVGDNPASQVYVRNKENDCKECGIYSAMYTLPQETSEAELLELLDALNHDSSVHGILVQLPVPKQIDAQKVIEAIDPIKDVDCFHPMNVGYLTQGMARFAPCTPAGIVRLMAHYGIDPKGKHCVVIGRSNIVGKPMSLLLLQDNGTVTICHSGTKDLKAQALQADILVSAVGKTGFVTADMVKEGAVVIDVAMNRNDQGKLCGDVDYPAVAEKASAITPVPGGVGPMTRVMLLENTLTACKLQCGIA